MLTNKDIRKAIAKSIKDALNDLYITQNVDNDMEVVVNDHWIFTFDTGTSAAALIPEEGTDAGKIHGWMVGTQSINRVDENAKDNPWKVNRGCSTTEFNGNKVRRQVTAVFKIWVFHQFYIGSEDLESEDNSENSVTLEIQQVSNWLSKFPTLGINNHDFVGHGDLQINEVGVFAFGDMLASGAKGTLTISYYDRF